MVRFVTKRNHQILFLRAWTRYEIKLQNDASLLCISTTSKLFEIRDILQQDKMVLFLSTTISYLSAYTNGLKTAVSREQVQCPSLMFAISDSVTLLFTETSERLSVPWAAYSYWWTEKQNDCLPMHLKFDGVLKSQLRSNIFNLLQEN